MRIPVLLLPLVLLACGEKDTGAWFDSSIDTSPDDTSVEVTWAEVEIINETGNSIFFVYQCESRGDVCIEEVQGTLPDGDSMIYQVDPGWWVTYIVDENVKCATSGEYELFAGDSYSWRVRNNVMNGAWDGSVCTPR